MYGSYKHLVFRHACLNTLSRRAMLSRVCMPLQEDWPLHADHESLARDFIFNQKLPDDALETFKVVQGETPLPAHINKQHSHSYTPTSTPYKRLHTMRDA